MGFRKISGPEPATWNNIFPKDSQVTGPRDVWTVVRLNPMQMTNADRLPVGEGKHFVAFTTMHPETRVKLNNVEVIGYLAGAESWPAGWHGIVDIKEPGSYLTLEVRDGLRTVISVTLSTWPVRSQP